MADEDPIKKLLLQTGWSYSEVLKKLEAYKDQFKTDSESKTCNKEPDKESESENIDTCSTKLSDNNIDSVASANLKEDCLTLDEIANEDEESVNTENKLNVETETVSDKVMCVKLDANKELSEQSDQLNKSDNNEDSVALSNSILDKVAIKDKKELLTSEKKLIVESETNAIVNTTEAKSDEELCEKLTSDTKEHSDKNGEAILDQQKSKTSINHIKCDESNSELKTDSEKCPDAELQKIMQRLEKFMEESAESDNEEIYTEMHLNKPDDKETDESDIAESQNHNDIAKESEKSLVPNSELESNVIENLVQCSVISRVHNTVDKSEDVKQNSDTTIVLNLNSNFSEESGKEGKIEQEDSNSNMFNENVTELILESESNEEEILDVVETSSDQKDEEDYSLVKSKMKKEENLEGGNLGEIEDRNLKLETTEETNLEVKNPLLDQREHEERRNFKFDTFKEEHLEVTDTPSGIENTRENKHGNIADRLKRVLTKELNRKEQFTNNEEHQGENLDVAKLETNKEETNTSSDQEDKREHVAERVKRVLIEALNNKDAQLSDNELHQSKITKGENLEIADGIKDGKLEAIKNPSDVESKCDVVVEKVLTETPNNEAIQFRESNVGNGEAGSLQEKNVETEPKSEEVNTCSDGEDKPEHVAKGVKRVLTEALNRKDCSKINKGENLEISKALTDLPCHEQQKLKDDKLEAIKTHSDLKDREDKRENVVTETLNNEPMQFRELNGHSKTAASPKTLVHEIVTIVELGSRIKSVDPTDSNQTMSTDFVKESYIKSRTFSQIRTVRTFKANHNYLRLRLLRKSIKTLNKTSKKKHENNLKVIQIEDIRIKLKEQLELLRTKRKSVELSLVSSKPSSSLQFPKRNTNRLNSITNILSKKLNSGENIQVPPKVTDESKNSLQVECLDIVNSEIQNKKPNSEPSAKSPQATIVLSNETDLMIINVVGGYKSPSPEVTYGDHEDCAAPSKKNNEECVLTGITPTKTTDVTKIKGWKNKKFAITNNDRNKPSDKLLLQLMNENLETSNPPQNSNTDDNVEVQPGSQPPSISEESKDTSLAKSAFISDELDQYLTENTALNISYEVPKLEAEQTITTKYIDIKFPAFSPQATQLKHTKYKSAYKPKTLAEKRKMLSKSDQPEINDFLNTMNSKQRKDYQESVLSMRKKLIDENVPFTRRCFMTSTTITNTDTFVVYNGKKIKVPGVSDKKIIAQITDKRKYTKNIPPPPQPPPPQVKAPRQRKPSLLSELKPEANKVIYDPTEWDTLQLKLPRITLEIKPQLGKRIDPRIEHYIKSKDTTLTENMVEFALTALKTNSISNTKIFKFPLSYKNNQTHITLRRKIPVVIDISQDNERPIESDSEISNAVSNVVNKLLDYIDVFEQTKDIMQYESSPKEEIVSSLPKIDNSPEKKWKKRKRTINEGNGGLRRTTLEMKRLNCKIVSIAMDEESNENLTCTKEFCRLGCVCTSIECNSANLLVTHCGKHKCMFKCRCKCKNMNVGDRLSLSTNLFSEGIINRLQDEAKKNLAKVEKEFTQTVIKTNNQIIVVGESNDRRRRATKMPKKYIDFVEEDPSEKRVSADVETEGKYRSLTERSPTERLPIERSPTEQPIIIPFTNKPVIQKTDPIEHLKNCYVKLIKCNIDDIIPYCLVHSLYKCHCKNKAIFDNNIRDENIVACKYVKPPKSSVPEEPARNCIKHRNYKTFNKELYSSRTRGLATSYYAIRNKSQSHKTKITRSSKKLHKDLEMYLRMNATKIMTYTEDDLTVVRTKPLSIPDTTTEPKHHRKQSLIVLEDRGSDNSNINSPELQLNEVERESKLQRRKRKLKTKMPDLIPKSTVQPPAAVVFGETNKFKSEFFALLGNKTSQLRLLPWTQLASRFHNGSFQIWYTHVPQALLAITENGKRPTEEHYNIKLFEHADQEVVIPSNIIRWLITKTVPLEKPVEEILIVVSFNKSYWEICGVCEKNKQSTKSKDQVSISLIQNWNCNSSTSFNLAPPKLNENDDDVDMLSADDDKPIPLETDAMLMHSNLQDNKKIMYCTKRRFQPKKLISDEIDNDFLKVRQVLWAPIPSVTLACKWRVIYMNVSFEYLSLSRSSYTIKYGDIMRAMKIAHSEKITIVLKSQELQKNYPHRNFGIYCVHNYSDKVFIGPYFLNENNDLDTLSYVNGVLVNTNFMGGAGGKQMQGSGRWYHQSNVNDNKQVDDDVVLIQEPPPVVDLTCESDEDLSNSCTSKPTQQANLLKSMLSTAPVPNPDTAAEVEEAEKTLDSLLKRGQLHVNKTIVQLDSLKPVDPITDPLKLDSPPPKNVGIVENTDAISDPLELPSSIPKNVENLANAEDASNNSDDDVLVVMDEGAGGSQHSEEETTEKHNANSKEGFEINRFLVTNVPGLGYISAYQHELTKVVDVVCPITKKLKQFSTPEAAISALERVFANKFVRVPTTFNLEFQMLDKIDDTIVPLDRTLLHGYHIVGKFGVRNLLRCSAQELENFGLDKAQITHMWAIFEKKLLWVPLCQLGKLLAIPIRERAMTESLNEILMNAMAEIAVLQNDSMIFIKEKIDLESKKVKLAQRCVKLQNQLPPNQRDLAQQKLEQIINFSNRQTGSSNPANENSKIKLPKLSEVSEPIVLDDDEDDVTPNNIKDPLGETSTTKSTPALNPIKYTSSNGPPPLYKVTSLLSGKKITYPIHQRSLISQHLKLPASQNDNRLVMLQRKRNADGNLVTSDLNKSTFRIPPNSEQKILLKEVPIKVRKDLTNPLQNQQKQVIVHHGTLGNIIRMVPQNKNILTNMPYISKIKPNTTVQQISSSSSRVETKPVAVASIGSPVPTPLTTNSFVIPHKSSMATLTPMPKPTEFVVKNSAGKITSNYIALKDGNNLKYYQLLAQPSGLQPVQSINLPNSSVKVKPSLKKIAPAPSPITYFNKSKTDK